MEQDVKIISEMATDAILIGGWEFFPALFKLTCGEKSVKLEPRAAYLLYYLAHNPNVPVSRDILMEKVWPNMVVGDEALSSAINKLRKAFGDDSLHPKVIETIPKAGYRLIAPVRILPRKIDTIETSSVAAAQSMHNSSSRWLSILSIVLLPGLVIYGFWAFFNQDIEESALADKELSFESKPSIFVLPFENISDDAGQEYFVDGITDDIITDLSRITNLRVLAGNTSFSYKGQVLDLKQIAKDLKVSHILEGSVRKVADNLRITARLIDAGNGQNLWAERYDRKLKDVFKVQDNVSHSIVTAMRVQLTREDREILEIPTTGSFEAYDLYLKGLKLVNERTKESNFQARELYRQAIQIDPRFARAYGALAVSLIRAANANNLESPQEGKDQALSFALQATALNSKSQNTYWALGFTHLYRQEFDAAAGAARKALIIAPNYADGLALQALIENHLGRAEKSIKLINKAMLINPYFTWDYPFNLGWANYTLGHYARAVELLQQALQRNENARPARLILAACYVARDMLDAAEWEILQILVQFPNTSLSSIAKEMPFADLEKMNRYLSHLEKAGLPE